VRLQQHLPNRGRDGTPLSKVRFLSVVGAKLRTEMVTVGRPPKVNITIAGTERLVAVRAAGGVAVLEIPAARDHQNSLPSEKQTRCCDLLNPAASLFGLTRLVNKQDIRTLQRIENRACNDPRILATDVKSISCGLSSMRVMCIENGVRN
jgi:hypothetical protein